MNKQKGINMLKEFKQFAMRGNAVDMAVGIIIGAAFGKIVSSLVDDVLMPPIGLLMGQVDFSDLVLVLKSAAGDNPAVTLNYGMFINNILDFIIVAFAIFILIKQMNKLNKPEAEKNVDKKNCPYCLTQIPIKATRCSGCTSEVK